jgi:hypothetical protein
VIDRRTKAIIWQYGVTDRKGHAPGYLNYPDGFDIDVFRDWKGVMPVWRLAKPHVIYRSAVTRVISVTKR